jgi:hypothetical protein
MEKINVMAKEDMIEDVRAVYGDCTAEQVKRSRAVTLVEIVIVDAEDNERLLDPITRTN